MSHKQALRRSPMVLTENPFMKAHPRTTLGCLSILLGSMASAATQLPIPDPGFGGPDGIARVAFDITGEQADLAAAATALVDGRLLLVGTAQVGANAHDIAFARLAASDGSLDTAFGPADDGRALAGLAPMRNVTD